MTDLEIQIALLEYYEENLAVMPRNSFFKAMSFVDAKRMNYGLCCCAGFLLGIDIYKHEWVYFNCNRTGYWYDRPYSAETIDEVEAALQFRINKLKEIIYQSQNNL